MDAAEVISLVAAKRPESLQLEYKRELPGGTDAAKSEFLADVAAMANAAGGVILYGVSEAEGCADAVVGIGNIDTDAVALRLDGILRSGIEPRIQNVALRSIDVEGLIVLEVEIPQSIMKPHWVSARGERRFHIRTSVGKAPMSIDEVRSAFQSAGDVAARASSWRAERAQYFDQLHAANGGLDMWMTLHVCPLAAFTGLFAPAFDPRPHRDHSKRLKTITTDNSNCRPHYDGLITEERNARGVLQERLVVYRDFRVEALWKAGGEHDPGKVIYAGHNELRINNWLTHFFEWAKANGYPFPALSFVTVFNARDSHIQSSWRNYMATSDLMQLRAAFVEDSNVSPAQIMRATYDHLWQSYGFEECILYDEDGTFNHQRYNPRSV